MIRRRWRLLLSLVLLLLLGGLALVPSVRWPVYGWLKGDAFYQRMPTSWWDKEVQVSYRSVVWPEAMSGVVDGAAWSNEIGTPRRSHTAWWRESEPSLWDRLPSWTPSSPVVPLTASLVTIFRIPLVDGDVTALPVLLELLHSEHAKVRQLAICGLLSLGPLPPQVVPALRSMVHDADADVSEEARWAVERIDTEAAQADPR